MLSLDAFYCTNHCGQKNENLCLAFVGKTCLVSPRSQASSFSVTYSCPVPLLRALMSFRVWNSYFASPFRLFRSQSMNIIKERRRETKRVMAPAGSFEKSSLAHVEPRKPIDNFPAAWLASRSERCLIEATDLSEDMGCFPSSARLA